VGRAVLVGIALVAALVGRPAAARSAESEPVRIRVAAYNVQYGAWCTPEQVAEALKPYGLDILGLSEVPQGGWSERVAKGLGMTHVFVGRHSPLGYKNKFKSILSRTPLEQAAEHHLGLGWSAVHARTTVRGVRLSVYSLHTGGTTREGCQQKLARDVIPKDKAEHLIMMGDFNATVGRNRAKRRNLMGPIFKAGLRHIWSDLGVDVEKHATIGLRRDGRPNPSAVSRYGVIDHILLRKTSGLRAVRGGMIEMKKPLSDHKPVWAELELGPKRDAKPAEGTEK
jgi:endonuclease/exonuclease/phosphatase family metal-dependent hydrolase